MSVLRRLRRLFSPNRQTVTDSRVAGDVTQVRNVRGDVRIGRSPDTIPVRDAQGQPLVVAHGTQVTVTPGGAGGAGGRLSQPARGGGDPAGGPVCPGCGAVGRGGHSGDCTEAAR